MVRRETAADSPCVITIPAACVVLEGEYVNVIEISGVVLIVRKGVVRYRRGALLTVKTVIAVVVECAVTYDRTAKVTVKSMIAIVAEGAITDDRIGESAVDSYSRTVFADTVLK